MLIISFFNLSPSAGILGGIFVFCVEILSLSLWPLKFIFLRFALTILLIFCSEIENLIICICICSSYWSIFFLMTSQSKWFVCISIIFFSKSSLNLSCTILIYNFFLVWPSFFIGGINFFLNCRTSYETWYLLRLFFFFFFLDYRALTCASLNCLGRFFNFLKFIYWFQSSLFLIYCFCFFISPICILFDNFSFLWLLSFF